MTWLLALMLLFTGIVFGSVIGKAIVEARLDCRTCLDAGKAESWDTLCLMLEVQGWRAITPQAVARRAGMWVDS